MKISHILPLLLLALGATAHADELKSNSVAARHLKRNAVISSKIASNAVTTAKVAAGAVTTDKLASDIGVFTKSGVLLTSGDLNILPTTVGLGVTNPTRGKLEVVGSVLRPGTGINTATYMQTGSTPVTNVADTGSFTSIFATDGIVAGNFAAISDARVKTVLGRSDSSADLQSLLGIEITDYLYKDTVQKGERPQKKVIAQQVETVFPQAVSTHPDVVPDLYAKAPVHEGWIQLATDLKVGDRVRLIGEKEDRVDQVTELRDGAFRTATAPAGGEVFVYGREVADCRSVDYEAIAMLNVSATQELARRLQEKESEITRLTKLVETLEARDRDREDRLAKLERALGNGGPAPIEASAGRP